MPPKKKSLCVKRVDVDIEKLISLVQQKPVLYNKTDPLHKETDVIDNVWQSIGEIMQVDGK